jgi:hypothetical protein
MLSRGRREAIAQGIIAQGIIVLFIDPVTTEIGW